MIIRNGLEFSQEQKQISGGFYNNSPNGIIIYTEDSHKEHEFYDKFFKRLLLDTDVKVDKTIQLGSCNDVQKVYENDRDKSFPRLYIIDGDIYLQYLSSRSHDRLFVLDRYCIENFLIDEKTIYSVMKKISKTKKSTREIKKIFSYRKKMKLFAKYFILIYFYYAILSEENKKIKNIKTAGFKHYKYTKFYSSTNNIYLEDEINKFIHSAKIELCNLPGMNKKIIRKKIEEKKEKYPFNIESLLKIVSAKDATFPFLIKNISKCFHFREMSLQKWKLLCVDFYDIEPLEELKNTIIDIYNDWNNIKEA